MKTLRIFNRILYCIMIPILILSFTENIDRNIVYEKSSKTRFEYVYKFESVKGGQHVKDLILEYSNKKGINPCFTYAISIRETRGQHYDAYGKVIRGGSGEYGMMQVMPYNFKSYHNKLSLRDNLDASTNYLKECLNLKNNYYLAASCYNRGASSKKINHKYSNFVNQYYLQCMSNRKLKTVIDMHIIRKDINTNKILEIYDQRIEHL